MDPEAFSVPQRQSILGVALIFSTTLYRFLRGFWVLGVYFILSNPSSATILMVSLGLVALGVLALGYSWLYYRKFLFHIDYTNQEFVLQKGVFSTEDMAIPFDKIQQVYLKRSLLQRLINVYSLVIETAGSKGDEVNIKAVTREDAQKLSSILIQVKQAHRPQEGGEYLDSEETPSSEHSRLWTHKLDFLTLLKIGISTNYIRGLALVIAFFTTIYNELNSFFKDYAEEVSEYYKQVPAPTESIGVFLVLFFILLLISIIITVVEVYLKYYGLTLVQTRESLELEMGLKTNTKVSLKPRRVQLMQIITNPVQKYFNLYETRIALASSENALLKKKIHIPGLGKDTVEKVALFLYGDVESNFEQMFSPHKLMLIRRLFFVFLPVAVSFLILQWFPYTSHAIWTGLAIGFTIIGGIYQYIRFRSLKLIFSAEFLQKKQGVWNEREERFELFKMQSVTVSQPFWYKKRNLINIVFHTAGGDVSFKAVNKDILPYINYILYKVESTNRKWM